jgi:hypothetical protein
MAGLFGTTGLLIVLGFIVAGRSCVAEPATDWCSQQYRRARTMNDTLFVDGMNADPNPARITTSSQFTCGARRLRNHRP